MGQERIYARSEMGRVAIHDRLVAKTGQGGEDRYKDSKGRTSSIRGNVMKIHYRSDCAYEYLRGQ